MDSLALTPTSVDPHTDNEYVFANCKFNQPTNTSLSVVIIERRTDRGTR